MAFTVCVRVIVYMKMTKCKQGMKVRVNTLSNVVHFILEMLPMNAMTEMPTKICDGAMGIMMIISQLMFHDIAQIIEKD
jgi:hypothetical protein